MGKLEHFSTETMVTWRSSIDHFEQNQFYGPEILRNIYEHQTSATPKKIEPSYYFRIDFY